MEVVIGVSAFFIPEVTWKSVISFGFIQAVYICLFCRIDDRKQETAAEPSRKKAHGIRAG